MLDNIQLYLVERDDHVVPKKTEKQQIRRRQLVKSLRVKNHERKMGK